MKEQQTVHFGSRHENGNIFWILGAVRMIMRKERRIAEYNDMWQEVQNCGSYEDALQIIGQHVRLIDDDTGKEYGNVQRSVRRS